MQRENTPVSVVLFFILVILDGIGAFASIFFLLLKKKLFPTRGLEMIDGNGEARNENCIVCNVSQFKIIVRIIA